MDTPKKAIRAAANSQGPNGSISMTNIIIIVRINAILTIQHI
jgi:hypothetical protein